MTASRRLLPLIALAAAALPLAACVPGQTMGGMPNRGQGYGQPGYGYGYQQPGYAQQACDTTIRVVNQSRGPVYSLYFSHSGHQNWGPDRLGQHQIPPGGSMAFQTQAPGPHDFRVVWPNGSATELRQVDVCRASQIVVTNRGLRAG